MPSAFEEVRLTYLRSSSPEHRETLEEIETPPRRRPVCCLAVSLPFVFLLGAVLGSFLTYLYIQRTSPTAVPECPTQAPLIISTTSTSTTTTTTVEPLTCPPVENVTCPVVECPKCSEPPTTEASISKECPDYWQRSNETKKCYRAFSDVVDWKTAREMCQSYDADLVTVHSEEENKVVMNFGRYRWLGMSDVSGLDRYEWVDGSELNYHNFVGREPSHKFGTLNEDCVVMITETKGGWNDISCDEKYSFVCEIQL